MPAEPARSILSQPQPDPRRLSISALAERNEPVDYESDFYAWTQEQADRLRALHAAGRLPAELDIDNIAEEIESLGRSDLNAVESQLVNVLAHLIKAVSKPSLSVTSHWRAEGIAFTVDMQRRYSRSMRSRVDPEKAWKQGLRLAEASMDAHGQRLLEALPVECPFSVEELLESGLYFDDLEAMLTERVARG